MCLVFFVCLVNFFIIFFCLLVLVCYRSLADRMPRSFRKKKMKMTYTFKSFPDFFFSLSGLVAVLSGCHGTPPVRVQNGESS